MIISTVIKSEDYELLFSNGRTPFAIIFDTVFWLSKSLEEENQLIPERNLKGVLINKLMVNYGNPENYWVLLDTVSYEFKEIIHQKVLNFSTQLRKYLFEANIEIKKGNRDVEVAKKYGNLLKNNPNINSVYGYYEKRGFGFLNLLQKSNREAFYKQFLQINSQMNETFNSLTINCIKKYYKEKIATWCILFKSEWSKFLKITPNIGKKDRFHILGCLFIAISENRSTKLITIDKLILSYITSITTFYSENKKIFVDQIQELG